MSTKDNPSDPASRELDRANSGIASRLRHRLWQLYGPLHFDLMALTSNVFRDPHDHALPFFSPYPVPNSSGTNVFAQQCPQGRLYCFPPFVLIPPLIRLLAEWGSCEAGFGLASLLREESSLVADWCIHEYVDP